jgi:hypothetical protein
MDSLAPLCNGFCFTREVICNHEKKIVPINNVGQYVLFPSKWFHQGFYNSDSVKVFVQAQLIARHSISIEGGVSTRTKDEIIEDPLTVESVMPLCNDILVNWDTTYSRKYFETCKEFDGPIDHQSNCQIPATKFIKVPLIQKLVDTFTIRFPSLTVDMVWLIVKSKPGCGFQTLHRDFYLDPKIIKTIVVNLGAMMRSDVPGEAFSERAKSSPEDSGDDQLKSPPELIDAIVRAQQRRLQRPQVSNIRVLQRKQMQLERARWRRLQRPLVSHIRVLRR